MKFKATAKFISEFTYAESGRHEDAESTRAMGDVELIEMNNYGCVVGDFIGRWKTQIEVRNDQELVELYYGLASGLIGLFGFSKKANLILDVIRPKVVTLDPDLVVRWPFQNGG